MGTDKCTVGLLQVTTMLSHVEEVSKAPLPDQAQLDILRSNVAKQQQKVEQLSTPQPSANGAQVFNHCFMHASCLACYGVPLKGFPAEYCTRSGPDETRCIQGGSSPLPVVAPPPGIHCLATKFMATLYKTSILSCSIQGCCDAAKSCWRAWKYALGAQSPSASVHFFVLE